MKLTFFGRLRDDIGMDSLDYSIPASVADSESLRRRIGEQYPVLLDPSVRIAVDDLLVSGAAPIAGAVEVAFLPPVSGG